MWCRTLSLQTIFRPAADEEDLNITPHNAHLSRRYDKSQAGTDPPGEPPSAPQRDCECQQGEQRQWPAQANDEALEHGAIPKGTLTVWPRAPAVERECRPYCFDRFRKEYNNDRPHEARVPGARRDSLRERQRRHALEAALGQREHVLRRRVVWLEEIDDGVWDAPFGRGRRHEVLPMYPD